MEIDQVKTYFFQDSSQNMIVHQKCERIQEQIDPFSIGPPSIMDIVNAQSSQKTHSIRPRKHSNLSVSPKSLQLIDDNERSEKSGKSYSIGPSNGSITFDETLSRYECIATLTQQQNQNLKQQNAYLLVKLRAMNEREKKAKRIFNQAKKYKNLYSNACMEINILQNQCQIYKQHANQMKNIILNDIQSLRQKVNQTQRQAHQKSQKEVGKLMNQSSVINNSESSVSKYIQNQCD